MRGANAAAASATAAKKIRSMQKAAKKSPIEALLAVDSGLRTFNINLDMFKNPFGPADPLTWQTETLLGLNWEDLKFVVFLADREGSQMLGHY